MTKAAEYTLSSPPPCPTNRDQLTSVLRVEQGTVLIIDDDARMLDSLATLLDAQGFRFLTASNGVRGLQMIRDYAPRVVLTDILMPEQDGIETIRAIRRSHLNVAIIAMSGGGQIDQMDLLRYARLLGADATITKPVDIDELFQLLHSFL